ncbi:MAG: Periplasmic beta-glucosidase precursor [Candidatus Izimaplasma bacterium HR2]|nr:MAG: Periplasmic beta-glucosidase precursor [Candidatus Izimaplasma bacterium HR2]
MDVKKLLKKMNLEEKIGQMLQIAPHNFISKSDTKIHGFEYDLGLTNKQVFSAGSVLGIGNAKEQQELQRKYLNDSRLKIPLLFMADIVHGYETIFPIPLALSCSWNTDTAFHSARISAVEASTAGIQVTFSPMADLSREPRWGRVMEGYGEDPYLLSMFVRAMVKGYQQDDISAKGNIASCVKHFAGYGAPIAGLDYNTVDMSRLSFYQTYLGGYEAAIDEGSKMVMASFNTFDGIPATVNQFLMIDVLRNQLNFNGVTITDYDGLNQVIAHRVAHDQREAAIQGVEAKIDIEMASSCYMKNIEKLIETSIINENDINAAVGRILSFKNELGLFDNPYGHANIDDEKRLIKSKEHLAKAKEIAQECAVLLKNESNILPLSNNSKVAVVGPYATSKSTNGVWSWKGSINDNISLSEALINQGVDVVYINGENPLPTDIDMLREIDIVICALGEDIEKTGEAKSIVNLELPLFQVEWIKLAKILKKKVVTVLYNGRPLVLNNIDQSDAILEAWYLGSKSNEALTDLLIGKINPSGKLTMSFPRHEGQIPIYYNHLTTGRPFNKDVHNIYTSFYLDCERTPKYPFGYGLSYSKFEYENMIMSDKEIYLDESITASITITNKSNVAGYEIVQLYIQDEVSKIARPEKELKGFKKILIQPYETKTVKFNICIKDLSYINSLGETKYEYGRFIIMIGSNSNNVQKKYIFFKENNNEDKKYT